MSDLITKKLEELTELARNEGENPVLIVSLALSAARLTNDDILLAEEVQKIVREVLIPRAKARRDNFNPSLN